MVLDFGEAGTYHLITTSTIERDIAISNILRASGARDALIAALTAGDEPDARIFDAVSSSGKLFELLGAALMPVADDEAPPAPPRSWLQRLLGIEAAPASSGSGHGGDPLNWSPAIAKATENKLKRITSPQLKQVLTLAVVELVKAFFLVGLHSLVTSRNSLAAQAAAAGVRPDGENGATSSSATGH